MTKYETLKLALEAFEALIDKFSDVRAYEDEEHAFTDELIFIPDIKKAIKAIAAAKQALAQPEERNFCPRCGKRTADLTTIHTCTPPT
jgi:NADH pyrophosphatase NudC (nudix superfamily)